MSIIQDKIKEYLNKKNIYSLQKELNIGSSTIYSILNNDNRKINKIILNKIYTFFDIEKDSFYIEKEKKFKGQEKNIIGKIFKQKREKLGYSSYYVAKQIKGTERHLFRIEHGYIKNYNPNSYYIKTLLNFYNFSEAEKNIIINYIKYFNEIKKIV